MWDSARTSDEARQGRTAQADSRGPYGGRSHSRRAFIAGLAAAGTGLPFLRPASADSTADPATARPYRIDVHSHVSPPEWIAALAPRKLILPMSRDWTPEKQIADMDRGGIATAIVSITTPGLWLGDAAVARRLVRPCNDYLAKLRADHPGRFGMFGALPLPDIDDALETLAYCLDDLKADGVGVFTSYGDRWLGDPSFDPVMAELNRRGAVAFVHPSTPNCCANLVPGIPDSTIEYGADTARAIARVIFGGAAARFPDIKLIFSHAGGTMPYLIERFELLARWTARERFPEGFEPYARRLYYDTAQSTNAIAMSGLKRLVPLSHILFGTDYPFRSTRETADELRSCGVFDAEEMQSIERDSALRLLTQGRADR